MYETDAIVLRSIRYGEADSVLTLLTRSRGRVSAIAKGTRKAGSRMGGRLQPGVRVHLGLAEGRGELHHVRQAQVIDAHAGLWVEGYRLRAAGCVLESAMRVLVEEAPNEGAFNLVSRSLAELSAAPPRTRPPRLDPIVLATQCKLLVLAGLFPRLGTCMGCGAEGPLVGFSATAGGALCADCARAGEPLDAATLAALAGLVGRPLAEAAAACPPEAEGGVERVVGLVLREHLGVVLRSAAPL